jgi:hypothetical protein
VHREHQGLPKRPCRSSRRRGANSGPVAQSARGRVRAADARRPPNGNRIAQGRHRRVNRRGATKSWRLAIVAGVLVGGSTVEASRPASLVRTVSVSGWLSSSRMVRGLLPGVVVADAVVDVAEVGEGGGFVVAVTEVAVQREGVVVAGERLGVLTEVMVGRSQGSPTSGPAPRRRRVPGGWSALVVSCWAGVRRGWPWRPMPAVGARSG